MQNLHKEKKIEYDDVIMPSDDFITFANFEKNLATARVK